MMAFITGLVLGFFSGWLIGPWALAKVKAAFKAPE